MRGRGSQSMYQQGKPGQQTGIVANKSMAVSKLMGDGLAGKSMMPNKSIKKVEGQDLGKTTKSNFEQTVGNLKNKPNKKVLEDEYIGGLQEQIKYLEYELKLLKDKELLEREGVNELDNFLKDQIPINENILAMKNKYNATKAKLEQQLSSLNLKKSEAEDVLRTQKGEIDRLHQIIDAHRQQKSQRTSQFRQKLGQIVKETTLARDQFDAVVSQNKRMQQQVKHMHEQISSIIREGEKQKIAEVRSTEERTKKRQKFQQKFKNDKEQLIETSIKCQDLDKLQDSNPLLKPLQDQNSLLRKRIMVNEKQRSTADNLIAQIELFLKEEERERETERQNKNKYLTVIDECKTEIQFQERCGDDIIRDQTLLAKRILIKSMNNQLEEKEDVYNLLSDRLRTLEQQCSNMIQDRKELTDALETQTKTEKQLQLTISELEEIIAGCRSRCDSLLKVNESVVADKVLVEDELEKAKGRLPIIEKQIERKTNVIHYLNKQVDLLKELKSLDLQQLHMISQSGSTMQNILNSFIKNWQKIKSQ